jgi:uncharacterized protein (TIGR02246 family)
MKQTAGIQATVDTMTNAFGRGDIDGILRTYEPGAVVVGERGVPISGTQALREMFAGFIAVNPKFTFLDHEAIEAGDLALHLSTWRMTGVAPDGGPVEQGGLSVVVLRRQANGDWLMVIDDPFGDRILKRAVSP